MKQKNAFILGLVWLLVMVGVVASTVTLMASGSSWSALLSGDQEEILDRYARLEEVRRALSEGFYREVDDETLINGAIRGMMAAVEDSYTFYYTPEEMELHEQETGKSYSGVGMIVQNNEEGFVEVIRVYEDGPADAAGILTGDLIVNVNGAEVSGESAQSLNDAVNMMRAQDGEPIKITVLHGNTRITCDVLPGEVNVNNVVYSMLDRYIGYIDIFQFSGNVAESFENAVKSLQQDGAEALIVDVRNNPGGLLDEVVDIADSLLPEGLIVYTEDREGKRESYYSDDTHCDLPLVVLVNEMSASASEILAAAIQDHGRGEIIGRQTFGKGVVQTLVTFESDGAGMQYTSACYYTPNGKNIHGTGVMPDRIVEAKEDFYSCSGIPDLENDLQLQAAIDFLKGA